MLKDKVLNTIKKYNMITEEDKNILVAVSGGFDSTCLLYVLNDIKEELGINIFVAHVNHCLRENAKIDEEFVRNLGEKLGIKVFVLQADINTISKEQKLSTEMAGRNVRYEFFEKIAQENNCTKIATAHNLNDNAETILLNMFRGTGLNGLKGIKKVRDGKYIRPLLETSRDEINEYLQENNIEARLDETNNECEYRRNKIRNEMIPYIKENFNDNILTTMNKMADIITQDDEYINNVVADIFNSSKYIKENNELRIKRENFVNNEINIQKRLILKCIENLLGTTMQIEEVHINDVQKLIEKNIGNKYLTPNKNLKISINRGIVTFEKIII